MYKIVDLTEFWLFFHWKAVQSVEKLEMATSVIPTVWKNEKFTFIEKIFRQINSLVTYLASKTVTFTKFLPKMREREFPVISTVCNGSGTGV